MLPGGGGGVGSLGGGSGDGDSLNLKTLIKVQTREGVKSMKKFMLRKKTKVHLCTQFVQYLKTLS